MEAAIDWFPSCTTVVTAKCTRCRDGNKDPFPILCVQNDRVQAHSPGARLPLSPSAVAAQSGKFSPRLTTVGRTEQCGIFNAGIDSVWIVEGRFKMPDAFELPWMRLAVVPLMGRERFAGFRRSIVDKLIAFAHGHALGCSRRFASRRAGLEPRLAAII